MGHLETGRKDFRLTTLIRVANALGVTLSDLFSGLERGTDSAPTTHKSVPGNQSLDRSKVLREVAILEQTVRNLRMLATEEEKSEKRAAAAKRRAKSKRAKE